MKTEANLCLNNFHSSYFLFETLVCQSLLKTKPNFISHTLAGRLVEVKTIEERSSGRLKKWPLNKGFIYRIILIIVFIYAYLKCYQANGIAGEGL